MWTRHHKERKFGRLVLPVITVAFLSYFGYHSVHGDLGLIATEKFEHMRAERADELAKLSAKRKAALPDADEWNGKPGKLDQLER